MRYLRYLRYAVGLALILANCAIFFLLRDEERFRTILAQEGSRVDYAFILWTGTIVLGALRLTAAKHVREVGIFLVSCLATWVWAGANIYSLTPLAGIAVISLSLYLGCSLAFGLLRTRGASPAAQP